MTFFENIFFVKFGVDVDEIIKMNKQMYDGLHATTRFKVLKINYSTL